MANEQIIVELLGENRDLNAAISDSKKEVKGFGASMQLLANGTIILGGIAKAFGALASAAGKALGAIEGFARKAFEAFAIQEAAVAKLEAVLKATGNAAGFTSEEMQKLASSMQQTSLFGDEVVLEAQAIIATFKNIRGDSFIRTTKAAANLATVMGTDLKGAANLLAKALDDPLAGLTKLVDAGTTFTEVEKEQVAAMVAVGDIMGAQSIMLDKLDGQFVDAAEAVANTFGGAVKQAEMRVGDLWEKIGEALIPVLQALMPVFDGVLTVLENFADEILDAEDTAVDFANTVQNAFNLLASQAVTAFTVMQTALTNWEESLGLVAINAGIILGEMANDLGRAFGADSVMSPEFMENLRITRQRITESLINKNDANKETNESFIQRIRTPRSARDNDPVVAPDASTFDFSDAGVTGQGVGLDKEILAVQEIQKHALWAIVGQLADDAKAADEANREDGPAQARLEGLMQLNDRITQAAASQKDDKVEKAVKDVGKKNLFELKKAVKGSKDQVDGINRVENAILGLNIGGLA